MKVNKISIIIFLILKFILFSFNSFSQEVNIVYQNKEHKSYIECKDFKFINPDFDLTNFNKVAIFNGQTTNSGKNNLLNLYEKLCFLANSIEANAYTIDSVYQNSDTLKLILSIYYINDSFKEQLLGYFNKNTVYAFGCIKNKSKRTLLINGKKVVINPLEYVSVKNIVGEETKLNIGGPFGTTLRIKGVDNIQSEFVLLRGLKIGLPINYIGIMITTGWLENLDMNLGIFLTKVLKNNKYTVANNM